MATEMGVSMVTICSLRSQLPLEGLNRLRRPRHQPAAATDTGMGMGMGMVHGGMAPVPLPQARGRGRSQVLGCPALPTAHPLRYPSLPKLWRFCCPGDRFVWVWIAAANVLRCCVVLCYAAPPALPPLFGTGFPLVTSSNH